LNDRSPGSAILKICSGNKTAQVDARTPRKKPNSVARLSAILIGARLHCNPPCHYLITVFSLGRSWNRPKYLSDRHILTAC